MGPLSFRRLSAGSFASAMAVAICAAPALGATGWSHPVPIYDGNFRDPSMAVDSRGHAHIAVRGDTGLWYVTDTSGSWVRTRLTRDHLDAEHQPVEALHPVIAVDPAGTVAVAYSVLTDRGGAPSSAPVGTLRMHTPHQGWSPPIEIPNAGAPKSIALTSALLAVASSSSTPPGEFMRVRLNIDAMGDHRGWQHRTVGQPGFSVEDIDPSIAIDSHGEIWVSYLRSLDQGATFDLRLAHGDIANGFVQQRVAAADGDVAPSLALSDTDSARIAYVEGDHARYAAQNASGWKLQTVMTGGFTALLALGRHDGPRIVTQDPGTHRIWYAKRHAGTWTAARVEDDRSVTSVGGMGVANGRVSISYAAHSGGDPRVWFTHTT